MKARAAASRTTKFYSLFRARIAKAVLVAAALSGYVLLGGALTDGQTLAALRLSLWAVSGLYLLGAVLVTAAWSLYDLLERPGFPTAATLGVAVAWIIGYLLSLLMYPGWSLKLRLLGTSIVAFVLGLAYTRIYWKLIPPRPRDVPGT